MQSTAGQLGDIQGAHRLQSPNSRGQNRDRIIESNDTSLITDDEIDQFIKEEYAQQK